MSKKEIRNIMNCLTLMCKDLNEQHDNYDIDTETERRHKQELIDAINEFNENQNIWAAKLIKTKVGWKIIYE